MKGPTEKQAQTLELIKSLTHEAKMPPTIRELATRLKVSRSAVLCQLLALERKKLIVRREKTARGLFLVEVQSAGQE